MLESLKFVQGAVAKKDFVPTLTHFRIENNIVKGYNGSLALASPIDLDVTASPKGTTFAKAIKACKDTVSITLTSTQRLSIKSGKFKAFVECTPEPFPDIEPEGPIIPMEPGLIAVVKQLSPFMGIDASRPWALGMLFRDGSVFATNNIIVVERWLGFSFPVVNIPAAAIKELIRINKDPISVQVCSTSITFNFEEGRWLKSQLSTLEWPDLSPLLDRKSNQKPFEDGFFDAVEHLIPFIDDLERLYLLENLLATANSPDEGASVELDPESVIRTEFGGCFNAKQLFHLKGRVDTIDFTQYPNPCLFFGDKIRGAIVGIRA